MGDNADRAIEQFPLRDDLYFGTSDKYAQRLITPAFWRVPRQGELIAQAQLYVSCDRQREEAFDAAGVNQRTAPAGQVPSPTDICIGLKAPVACYWYLRLDAGENAECTHAVRRL